MNWAKVLAAAWSRAMETQASGLISGLLLMQIFAFNRTVTIESCCRNVGTFIYLDHNAIQGCVGLPRWPPLISFLRGSIVSKRRIQPGWYQPQVATRDRKPLGTHALGHHEGLSRIPQYRTHHSFKKTPVLRRCLSTVLTARNAAELPASGDALWGARRLWGGHLYRRMRRDLWNPRVLLTLPEQWRQKQTVETLGRLPEMLSKSTRINNVRRGFVYFVSRTVVEVLKEITFDSVRRQYVFSKWSSRKGSHTIHQVEYLHENTNELT